MPQIGVLGINDRAWRHNVAGVAGAVAARLAQGNVEVHDSGSDVNAAIRKGDARSDQYDGKCYESQARAARSKSPT